MDCKLNPEITYKIDKRSFYLNSFVQKIVCYIYVSDFLQKSLTVISFNYDGFLVLPKNKFFDNIMFCSSKKLTNFILTLTCFTCLVI